MTRILTSDEARAMVKLARGVKKNYTAEERERRRKLLAEVRKRRWPKSVMEQEHVKQAEEFITSAYRALAYGKKGG